MSKVMKNIPATSQTTIAKPLTEDEQQLLDNFRERKERSWKLPYYKDKVMMVQGHEEDEKACNQLVSASLAELCKTDHPQAIMKVIASSNVLPGQDGYDGEVNGILQQFASLEPGNYLETMLISQMIQVNSAAGKCMKLAFLKDQTQQARELNVNLATKLQRTFVSQIEALQKLRGKGGQKVTVEHVNVHEGGQAIVGNVNHAPSRGDKNGD